MNEINGSDILKAAAVVLAFCTLVAAIWKGVEALRKLTKADERAAKEAAQDAAITDLKARMERCEERLERGDRQFADSREDMTQMLKVLNVMLMHFISGNDHEKLRDVKSGLDDYLAGR